LIDWRVSETTEKDPVFGTIVSGMSMYQKHGAHGPGFFTEDEPFDLPGDP
jgi:hypothetical protein